MSTRSPSSLPKHLKKPFKECNDHLAQWRAHQQPMVWHCQGELLGVGVTPLLEKLQTALTQTWGETQIAYLDWNTLPSEYHTIDGLRKVLWPQLAPVRLLFLDHVPWWTDRSEYSIAMGEWLTKTFLPRPSILIYGSLRFWEPQGSWPSITNEMTISPIQWRGKPIPWELAQQFKETKDEQAALLAYLKRWQQWERRNLPLIPLSERLKAWCQDQGAVDGWDWPAPWLADAEPETEFHEALKPWLTKACNDNLLNALQK